MKFHDKHEQKMDNYDYFTVDVHPTYKDSRCFFVVKLDKSKEVLI